jgi:hypothetical protein
MAYDSAKLPALEVGTESVDGMYGVGIQTPELTKKGKVTRTAFRDAQQAWSVYNSLESDNRYRTSINAEIVSRHTGKPPRVPEELKANSQGWRSNFPTLSLMGIESRITARLISAIDSLRVLTNSRLPESIENHDIKSKKFQDRITSYIRRWDGWRPFMAALCTENVLIGYALATLLDDYNWRPRLRRSDEAFLPQGCAQSPDYLQVAGIKESFLIHECMNWIENQEAADVAGFDVKNVIQSINRSMPRNPLWDQQGQGNLSRTYQDLMREGNVGLAYSTGAKGVDVAHMVGIENEPPHNISHYILDRNNEHNPLFYKENRYNSMRDCLCMFTLEPGNSTYYGSKGVGRKCVNIAAAIDAAMNDAVDNFRLSTLAVLRSSAQGGVATQVRMTNPFVIVTTDAELEQKVFNFNPEAPKALAAMLQLTMENAVGEYVSDLPADPVNPEKKERTATGERIDYQREQQQTVAFVARFLGQFFDMVQAMQKRLCNPETNDEEAQAFQKDLQAIDGLQPDEIKILAKSATAEVVQDLAAQRNQQMDAIAQKYMGNPNVNQMKLLDYDIAAMSSPAVADELILPQGYDPTVKAENVRQQIIENATIQTGESVPISPRDEDKDHLDLLVGAIKHAMPGLMNKSINDPDLPQLLDNLNAALRHGDAHVDAMTKKGGKNGVKMAAPYKNFMDEAEKQLTAGAKALQDNQQQQQQAPPGQQQGAPPMGAAMNGSKPAAPASNQKESLSIAYKDAGPFIKAQMEKLAGFIPDPAHGPPPQAPPAPEPQPGPGEPPIVPPPPPEPPPPPVVNVAPPVIPAPVVNVAPPAVHVHLHKKSKVTLRKDKTGRTIGADVEHFT